MLGVELIPLPAHRSDTGTLVALDRAQSLPFYLQRMFVIFACARGARRAEHATSAHHALLPVQGGSASISTTARSAKRFTSIRRIG
jgi:hypothetical protein